MSRRQLGRVRQLASGRWQARYKGPDGRERVGPRTFDTADESEQFLAAMTAELASGEWIGPLLDAVPFGEYADRWLTLRTEQLSPRTEELYRQLLRNHILPRLDTTPRSRAVRGAHGEAPVQREVCDLARRGRQRRFWRRGSHREQLTQPRRLVDRRPCLQLPAVRGDCCCDRTRRND